jgi:outer membrane lipoprotein-sorting protein
MSFGRVPVATLLLCLLFAGLSSCISHHVAIARKGGSTTQRLLVADQNSLLESVARQYNAVRDFSAMVDMAALVGSSEKGQLIEYKDVRAYIYFRKPSELHLVGLYPVVRTTAFDMVSSGAEFKLYVPKDNSFTVGSNDVDTRSDKKLENLRPQHFLDAIRVRPLDPAVERVLMENLTDEDYFYYILHLIREDQGKLLLSRTIWFSRLDLRMARQLIYDSAGNIITDARYSQWHAFDNVAFPKHIEIHRPREEYGATIDIVKMDINKGVSDDKFVLPQPEGTVLKVIGQKPKGTTP